MHFGLFLWGLLMRLLRLLRCVRRVYRVCVCVAPGQSLERWPLSTCRWTSSCWHAELPNLYWIFSSENGPLQMTEPFHSPRQNYAILKKDARARARHFFNFFLLSFESLLSRQLRFHDFVFFFEFFRVGMRPSTPRVKVRKCAELRKYM